jgi:integrase
MGRELTDQLIDGLRPPAGKANMIEWDAIQKGFGVRVSQNRKSWVIQCRIPTPGTPYGKQISHSFADVCSMPVAEARKEARHLIELVKRGVNLNDKNFRPVTIDGRLLAVKEALRKNEAKRVILQTELQHIEAEIGSETKRLNLSDEAIAMAIKNMPPRSRETIRFNDATVPGLAIRISGKCPRIPAGQAKFVHIFSWHGKPQTKTYQPAFSAELIPGKNVGDPPISMGMNVTSAKRQWAQDRAELAKRRDPRWRQFFVEEETWKNYTLRKLVEDYLRGSETRWRMSTYTGAVYALCRVLALTDFADQPAAQITTAQIASFAYAVLPGQRGYSAHAHQIAALRRLYSWGVAHDKVPSNPVTGIKIAVKKTKTARVLTDAELRALWIASGTLGYPLGPYFQLLVLLGQRRTETAEMRWSEIDLAAAVWTIPATRTTNHRPRRVFLPPQAVDIFKTIPHYRRSDVVFTTNGSPIGGFSNLKTRLVRATGINDWCLDDLRRSMVKARHQLEHDTLHMLQQTGFDITAYLPTMPWNDTHTDTGTTGQEARALQP